jgi:hypothetical protein
MPAREWIGDLASCLWFMPQLAFVEIPQTSVLNCTTFRQNPAKSVKTAALG